MDGEGLPSSRSGRSLEQPAPLSTARNTKGHRPQGPVPHTWQGDVEEVY